MAAGTHADPGTMSHFAPQARSDQGTDMQIRRFRTGDAPALHPLRYGAIHKIAARDYTPQQIRAWAPECDDTQCLPAQTPATRCGARTLPPSIPMRVNGYATSALWMQV